MTDTVTIDTEDKITLLQAALEQAGRITRNQSQLIAEIQGELRLRNNQIADWQQRCQSLSERVADLYPPAPDAVEMDRLRAWVVELESRLDAEHTLNLALQSQVREWAAKYHGSVKVPGSGLLETQPTSTADAGGD